MQTENIYNSLEWREYILFFYDVPLNFIHFKTFSTQWYKNSNHRLLSFTFTNLLLKYWWIPSLDPRLFLFLINLYNFIHFFLVFVFIQTYTYKRGGGNTIFQASQTLLIGRLDKTGVRKSGIQALFHNRSI